MHDGDIDFSELVQLLVRECLLPAISEMDDAEAVDPDEIDEIGGIHRIGIECFPVTRSDALDSGIVLYDLPALKGQFLAGKGVDERLVVVIRLNMGRQQDILRVRWICKLFLSNGIDQDALSVPSWM